MRSEDLEAVKISMLVFCIVTPEEHTASFFIPEHVNIFLKLRKMQEKSKFRLSLQQ